MKKIIFLAAMAALMMASCSKDEVIEQYKGEEISFNALTNNATRATPATVTNLKTDGNGFMVFGFKNPGGAQYIGTSASDGVKVSWNGSKWDYTPKAYWTSDVLDFYAVYPYGATTKNITSTSQSIDNFKVEDLQENQVDLMYARTTNKSKSTTPVTMYFKHALSQIVFKGKIDGDNLTVNVNAIKVCNVLKNKGTYTFGSADTGSGAGQGSWGSTGLSDGTKRDYTIGTDGNITLNNSTSTSITNAGGALLLIPQTLTAWTTTSGVPIALPGAGGNAYLEISCIITLDGADVIGTSSSSTYGTIYVPFGATWQQGKKYIYTLIFGGGYDNTGNPILTPIEFDIDVENWDDQSEDINL